MIRTLILTDHNMILVLCRDDLILLRSYIESDIEEKNGCRLLLRCRTWFESTCLQSRDDNDSNVHNHTQCCLTGSLAVSQSR